jgi:hypothetical protein
MSSRFRVPLVSLCAAFITLVVALFVGPSQSVYLPAVFLCVWIVSYVVVMRLLSRSDS